MWFESGERLGVSLVEKERGEERMGLHFPLFPVTGGGGGEPPPPKAISWWDEEQGGGTEKTARGEWKWYLFAPQNTICYI